MCILVAAACLNSRMLRYGWGTSPRYFFAAFSIYNSNIFLSATKLDINVDQQTVYVKILPAWTLGINPSSSSTTSWPVEGGRCECWVRVCAELPAVQWLSVDRKQLKKNKYPEVKFPFGCARYENCNFQIFRQNVYIY